MHQLARFGDWHTDMTREPTPHAIVVGAGPNGLAAAIRLAQRDRSVLLYEAAPTVGGGTRSAELTLPGFVHDVCSAIHPLALASPFLRTLPLAEHGLVWVHPPLSLAHPFDDGTAAVLDCSVDCTALSLGTDGSAYRKLLSPLVADWEGIADWALGPLRWPRHPLTAARFGLLAVRSASGLAAHFSSERGRGLIAGLAAHSILPLDRSPSGGVALLLALLAHAVGWPVARGGSQQIANALASHLQSLGGQIVTNTPVRALDQLPPGQPVLFDVTPRQLVAIAGERLPVGYRRRLSHYRYGPGVFKVDWALDAPIPWRAPECLNAGTVHLGGAFDEIAASEAAVWRGDLPERPFTILAQPSLFDPTRAPAGKQTAWAYCHVPHGSPFDLTERIEAQIERFAPGFRDRILARHVMSPADLERHNPNCVGGDINGGVQDLRQFYTRPTVRLSPYATADPDIYLCSSSTPPGGGVHGMCGYFAAEAALKRRVSY